MAAVSVAELEPLAVFHERVAAVGLRMSDTPGRLLPEDWTDHRRRAQTQGIIVAPAAWKSLVHWARRLGVDVPEP